MKKETLLPEQAYHELTGQKPSREQLGRWHRLHCVLEIARGDALWSLIIAFEFYNDCFQESASKIAFWARIVSTLLVIQILATMLVLRSLTSR